jgi:hypothetical protein
MVGQPIRQKYFQSFIKRIVKMDGHHSLVIPWSFGKTGGSRFRAVAQTNRLSFDRACPEPPFILREPQDERLVEGLRANGDILKSCVFSAHAELVEA